MIRALEASVVREGQMLERVQRNGLNVRKRSRPLLLCCTCTTKCRRYFMILVISLVTVCLVLLITTITSSVSCTGDASRPRHRSGPSSAVHMNDSSSLCPDPWILNSDKCYFFSEIKKNQKKSKEDCESRNARLATVKEAMILKLVTITEKGFWIGLEPLGTHHNKGTWSGRWADGSIVNVTEGSGTCVKISRGLSLHNCHQELHWICERDLLDL